MARLLEEKTQPVEHQQTDNDARRGKLVEALRTISPAMREWLEHSKAKGAQWRQESDLVWDSLLRAMATMGNARGERGLFENPELSSSVTFAGIGSVSPEQREGHLERVFRLAKFRMPHQKATWMAANFVKITEMGGADAARRQALGLLTREAKFQFMLSFHGIGEKYARDMWMDLYDSDFRDSIALDVRVQAVTKALGYSFADYADHEAFYCAVAQDAKLEPWEVDRLLYRFQSNFLAAIES